MEDTEEIGEPLRSFISGSRDTELIVLSKLNDRDLLNVCLTNREINKACKNENFWRERFINRFDSTSLKHMKMQDYPSKYKKDTETWRDFYLKFLKYTEDYRMPSNLLQKACFLGDLSLVVYALNSVKSIIDTSDSMPLKLAAQGNYYDIIKYLINRGAFIPVYVTIWLSHSGNYDIVKFLIEKGADITIQNNLPIRMAGNAGRFNNVLLLSENGADIHSNDDEILLHASRRGNIEMIKYLLKHGANINRTVNSTFFPLPDSISYGQTEAAKFLIDSGADVNISNGLPLKNAIKFSYLDIVKYLIEHGANPNIVFTEENQTPLEYAKSRKEYEIYQYLKEL